MMNHALEQFKRQVHNIRYYYVIFREDSNIDGTPGRYYLPQRTFDSYSEAETYAKTIAKSREPKILVEA